MSQKVTLDTFSPRWYQAPLFDAIENKGYKRVLAILPRRAGKDIAAFNLCIRQCLKTPCVVYYILPTYAQAKKTIWDSITNDGMRFLDFIPSEVIASKNSQEMKIWFINGSLLQLVGSDNYDRLMGTNPKACVFSEYALQDPKAFDYIRPILLANDGWALFVSTPRGKQNALWRLYQMAEKNPQWYCYKLTVDDTQHISKEAIEQERREGLMSEDMIQQEYYTSFAMGIEGAYYAKYLDEMRRKDQIGNVPYSPKHLVHTAWDLGMRDSTAIIFFQLVGTAVHIIDCHQASNVGLEDYVKVIYDREYVYGKHIAPHDIRVRELTSGTSRWEKARELGVTFTIAPNMYIMDGIEAVRSALPRTYVDQNNCQPVIDMLENYRKEWDEQTQTYKRHPFHDKHSHMADAMRMLAITMPQIQENMTPEDIEKIRQEAQYGKNTRLPSFFQHSGRRY